MYHTLRHLGYLTILGDSSHNTSNASIQAAQLPIQNPGKEEMLSLFSGISGTHQVKSACNNAERTR